MNSIALLAASTDPLGDLVSIVLWVARTLLLVIGGGGGLIGKLSTLSEVMGGLIGKGEGLAGSISDKLMPVLGATPGAGLTFTLGTLAFAFGGAKAAATVMDKKMYESTEACEYVAKRYHWSEDQVNQYGYTWTETGHLVALASQNM